MKLAFVASLIGIITGIYLTWEYAMPKKIVMGTIIGLISGLSFVILVRYLSITKK